MEVGVGGCVDMRKKKWVGVGERKTASERSRVQECKSARVGGDGDRSDRRS